MYRTVVVRTELELKNPDSVRFFDITFFKTQITVTKRVRCQIQEDCGRAAKPRSKILEVKIMRDRKKMLLYLHRSC
jgi:hypothetical protein